MLRGYPLLYSLKLSLHHFTFFFSHSKPFRIILLDICGSLNVIDPYKLIGNGAIGRQGFAGVSTALLKEVCHCGDGLWGLIYVQVMPNIVDNFLLPVQDIELSATSSAPCLSACCLTPMMIMD